MKIYSKQLLKVVNFTEKFLYDLIVDELPGKSSPTFNLNEISDMKVVDTGIDSLSFFSIISELEDTFNIEIPDSVITESITFKELFLEINALIE